MTELRRWWRVTCSAAGCRWRGGERRGVSVAQVTRFGCPKCGAPVIAVPTAITSTAVKTMLFPHNG